MTVTEGVEVCLARIAELDPRIGAFLHVDEQGSLTAARRLDLRILRGERPGSLAGVPVAVKDNICVAGMPLTCASHILDGYRAPYDATAVARLRAAGAIIIGKTNLDEFAMGSSTENSAYRVTRNPWDLERSPGGSSGGSAAAVAAGLVPLAIGSDTGGSIRQPASMCGVAGIKPTYGRISRWGLVAHASSLDQIGPLAMHLEDAWEALVVMAGADEHDATTLRSPPPCAPPMASRLEGLSVGRPTEWVEGILEPDVARAVEAAYAMLAAAGARLVDLSLPHIKAANAAYYIIASAEASSNLARYDGVRFGPRAGSATVRDLYRLTRTGLFGAEVKRRIMTGTFALSAGYKDRYYREAVRVRDLVRTEFARAFTKADIILGPVAPGTAFGLGEKLSDPLEMYRCDLLTVGPSLAGLPALSVPFAHTRTGLPIGLQVIAPAGLEEVAMTVGLICQHEALSPAGPAPMARRRTEQG